MQSLRLLLLACLVGTTTYAMVDQKNGELEQKIPQIKAIGPYALYGEIYKLLRHQQYTPQSIVTAIKQQKINVNAHENDSRNGYIGWPALHIAVDTQPSYTGMQIPQIFIDAGADVNARINNTISIFHGCTVLHVVLLKGWFGYLHMLLNADADVQAKINNPCSKYHDWTPLQVVAYRFPQYGSVPYDVFQPLVALGADIRGVLCKVNKSERFYAYYRKEIVNAIIQGKMNRLRERVRRKKNKDNMMEKLTALFDTLSVLDDSPVGVKQLAVAYDGGDHPAKAYKVMI